MIAEPEGHTPEGLHCYGPTKIIPPILTTCYERIDEGEEP